MYSLCLNYSNYNHYIWVDVFSKAFAPKKSQVYSLLLSHWTCFIQVFFFFFKCALGSLKVSLNLYRPPAPTDVISVWNTCMKASDNVTIRFLSTNYLSSCSLYVCCSSDRSLWSGEAGGLSPAARTRRGRGSAQQARHRPAVQRRPTGTLAGQWPP